MLLHCVQQSEPDELMCLWRPSHMRLLVRSVRYKQN